MDQLSSSVRFYRNFLFRLYSLASGDGIEVWLEIGQHFFADGIHPFSGVTYHFYGYGIYSLTPFESF
jgi:hypothetical protein